jgi:hypothetical protein
MVALVATSSQNRTERVYVSPAAWRDSFVYVQSDEPCEGHRLQVMHHGNGGHYCPTGFLICYGCFGIAIEPPPYSCTVWSAEE